MGFLRWLDASDYRWDMPRGIDQLNRRVVRLPNERQTSPVTVDRYTPEQLAEIIRNSDDFMRAVILISLNCSFSHAEIGRVRCSDFALHTAHPHADKLGIETSTADSWLFMNRPKTHIYGEWWLWPETVVYAQKAIERAKRYGSERIC